MGPSPTSFNWRFASQHACLHAFAAMLACAFALAAVALGPFASEKAHAADPRQDLSMPSPVIITAPAGVEGTLQPVYLKELAGFPNQPHIYFSVTSQNLKNGIESVDIDAASGVLTLTARPGGGTVSPSDFDAIQVKFSDMESYNDFYLDIQVHYKPKLDFSKTVEVVNGTYDPLNPGKKFFGYNGTGTQRALIDGIDATYLKQGSPDIQHWADVNDIPDANRTWLLREAGWRYLYRNADGSPIVISEANDPTEKRQIPLCQTFKKQGDRANIEGSGLEAPVNAGDYQLTIAAGYVQQQEQNGSYPEVREAAGWTTINFTVAKAPAFHLEQGGTELLDLAGDGAIVNISDTPGLPADHAGSFAHDEDYAPYSLASFTENGLESATIDPKTGELALVASGKANGKTDEVVVSLSGMGNYEDSTVTVPVTYTPKPVATISGPKATTGLVYNGTPHTGYTGEPAARYKPYGEDVEVPYEGRFAVTYAGTLADGTAYGPVDQAPIAAGDYTVAFSPEPDMPCAGSLVLEFAIEQAPLVFRAGDASMVAGGSLPTLGYTVEGLVGADRVIKDPSLAVEGDASKAGYCTIAISNGVVDNQASYRTSYKQGTLTVHAAPKSDKKADPLLAPTGDNALSGLAAALAGASALALGLAVARARRRAFN